MAVPGGACAARPGAVGHDRRVVDLIEHLESYLGLIAGGSRGDETTPDAVQVAWFGPDVPFAGVTTLVTVGLSRRHLDLPDGGPAYQELLMHVPNDEYPARAAGLLFQVAGEMVDRRAALADAQVIGPRGPLFPKSHATALIAIGPRYLPAEFAVCHLDEPPVPVRLTWLVPITTGEAALTEREGWPALADTFAAEEPDLSDPGRSAVTAAGPGN
jgi:hypothetical protein